MNIKLFSRFLKALFVLVMVLIMALLNLQPAHAAGVCYVKANAGGANTGSSWVNAYTDLQSALGASACTEVWVAAGTYKPTSGIDRTISFTLKNGVALYGGFAGTETLLGQRNPATNLTTLSGNIGAASVADNSYHVVNGGGTDGTAVLDGFTVKDGKANGSDPDDSGGGMYNLSSSPTLTNVIFNANSATTFGCGMFNNGSSPTLTNVTFSSNSWITSSTGCGMYNLSSSPTLTNVTFSGNSAFEAGGMYNKSSSSPILTNVTFSGNSAINGGGMINDGSSPTLTNVTFNSNSASNSGGGMSNSNVSSPTLTNVTFSSNSASNSGGGMFNGGNSSPTLTNVTFSGNSASSSGGGMYNNNNSNPQVRDTIFWGNSASVSGAEIYNNTSSPNLADSVVAGGCPPGATCTNIITTDPLLGPLANNGGFTQTRALLGMGSSAVDTGNDATCASADQRGVARPKGAHCDIGAYELIYYRVYLPLVIR